MTEFLDLHRAAAQLPRLRQIIGSATVDVFGYNQCYAFFNELNYRPRPIFQSYVAYSPHLAKLNEQRYLSDARPEFVLFRLTAIDKRLPALEDALLFRALLINYDPIAAEEEFLLLQHKQTISAGLSLVGEGIAGPGETIDLRRYEGTDLWMQIEMMPSFRGRLRQFFFQVPKVQLGL